MVLSDDQKNLVEEIRHLKKKMNAIVLVHNYQRPEIYEVADFIGDSLGLCQKASRTNADTIVFCGVNFMAETAKILNPEKRVLVPHPGAGCAMADMISADDLIEFKKDYPGVPVVCYVNSTAEVKAVSDVCCTSSNAVEVVKSLPDERVIFVPDQNLAAYVGSQVPEKEIIAWKGHCPVHHFVNSDYVESIKRQHPDAKIIAHPETPPEVTILADYVASTSGMIDCAKHDSAHEFFILTECGMTERLKRELPSKDFFGLCNMCFDMKKNTLQLVLRSLQDQKEEIFVDSDIAEKASKSLKRMMDVN